MLLWSSIYLFKIKRTNMTFFVPTIYDTSCFVDIQSSDSHYDMYYRSPKDVRIPTCNFFL